MIPTTVPPSAVPKPWYTDYLFIHLLQLSSDDTFGAESSANILSFALFLPIIWITHLYDLLYGFNNDELSLVGSLEGEEGVDGEDEGEKEGEDEEEAEDEEVGEDKEEGKDEEEGRGRGGRTRRRGRTRRGGR